MNFNQLTIIGCIGKNAEIKQLPNGTSVTKFSVATTHSWKDDKGEWKDKTQWHTVVAYGRASRKPLHVSPKAHTSSCRENSPRANTIAPSKCPMARKRSSM
ncbi:MAG: single-stranded DNA-binding protein [Acidobacteriaceae bacterium]|nr:single-stranded DNA-binding protein [Acidobacteriaceae bacterium]